MALPKRRDRKADTSVPTRVPQWASLYEIENPHDVEGYVSEHPTLAAVLTEAPGEIAAVFGNDARPRLRLSCDA